MSTTMEKKDRDVDVAKSSMDMLSLNNLMVSLRGQMKRVRLRVINKLSRQSRQLKTSKATPERAAANQKKALKIVQEIGLIKEAKVDHAIKFALGNTDSFDKVAKEGDIELKAITRLATHPIIEEKVSKWRKEHEDWKALAAFLMSKNTGRRYKKNKNKKITTISKKEKKLPTTGQSGEADQGPPTVAQKPKQRDGPSAKDLGKQASLEFKKNHIDKLLAIRLARKTGSLANLGPPDEDVQQLTQGEVPEAEVEEDSKEEKDTGSSNDKSETVRKNDDAADVSDISDDGEVPEAKVEEDSKEEKDTGSSNDKSETVRKNDDAADVSDISDDGEVPEAEVEEDSKEEKDTGSSNEKSETVRKNDDAADVSDISDDDVSKDQASSESSEAESASQEESVSQEESSNDAEDSSVEAEETRTKITPHPSEPTTRGKTGDLKPKKHSQQDSVHKKTYTVDATLCKEMEIRAINLSDISEVGDIPVTKQNDPEVGFLFKSNQVKDDSNKTLVTVNKKKKRDSFFASVDGASDDDDTNDDVAHPGPAGTEEEEEDESYAYHIYARQKIQSTFVKALSTHKEQSHTDSFDKRQGHRGFSRQREEHFSPMGRGRGSGRGDHQRHDRSSGISFKDPRSSTSSGQLKKGGTHGSRPGGTEASAAPLHPSWEASRKRKEQTQIHIFQGKKTKFDD